MPETPSTNERHTPRVKRGFVRSHFRWFVGIYLFLLLASNIADWQADEARVVWGNMFLDRHDAPTFEVDTTGLAVNVNPLPYRVVIEGDADSTLPPVLLLHGSPGAAYGFEGFAPKLTEHGRRVIYLDLPGFASQNEPWSRGSVFEDYGSDTYAAILWRLLEAMGDEQRVHIVGWSNSGAVGLRMIELHPDRVATLTMLAAVGTQENEGTGSYAFEHFKYKVGRAVLDHGSHLYPHFGLLGPMGERNAFLRFFDDTDQRDLGALMERVDTPTMIMHGRHDFLIADRAAEDHYRRMKSARLVMLDAMHFIPMMDAESTLAASYLNPFFDRHDLPGVEPETDYVDLAPIPYRTGGDAFVRVVGMGIRAMPWWSVLIAATILIRVRPNLGIAIVMLFVVLMDIDFGIALLAMLAGRGWWLVRGAGLLDRPWTVLGWVRGLLYPLAAFVIGAAGGVATLRLADDGDWLGLVVGIWLTWLVVVVVRLIVTWEGRQRIRGGLRRLSNHEYYPAWVLYGPVLCWGFVRVITGKGLRPMTAVNPGYAYDGGLKDERKSTMESRFGDDEFVLRSALVEPDEEVDARVRTALGLIGDKPELGGMPIIAKPDQGQNGRDVKIVRSESDLRAYCERHPQAFVLQRYHPGPVEVGLLWVRNVSTITRAESPLGFISGITIKVFPEIEGDGRRSLRQLVLKHPRFRAQASVLVEHLGDRQHEILTEGETTRLSHTGNHVRGVEFLDGAELITPELSVRIDSILGSFRDEQGRGFDIGRFDLRCTSYEALRRGEEMGIVELNGLTSEPTHIYDHQHSIFWAWGVLLDYWKHAAALGEARIAHGSGQPISRAEARRRMIDLFRVMSP